MEMDDKIFKQMADILRPSYYGEYLGRMFTLIEVKMLCIDAALWIMDKHGDEKIDINDFFKLKNL